MMDTAGCMELMAELSSADRVSFINGAADSTAFSKDIIQNYDELLKQDVSPEKTAVFMATAAEILYQRDECYEALVQVVGAIPMFMKSNDLPALFASLYIQMCIMIVTGQLRSIRPIIESMGKWIGEAESVTLRDNYEALGAWCAMYDGDSNVISDWMNTKAPNEFDTAELSDVFRLFIKARIYLLEEKYIAVIPLLQSVMPVLDENGRVMDMCELNVLYALACYGCGRKDDAFDHLETALKTAEERRFDRMLADEGEKMFIMLKEYISVRKPVSTYPSRIIQLSKKMALLYPKYLSHHKLGYDELTNAEMNVLKLMADGRTNAEIAEFLDISVNTVKFHAKNLFRKLGAASRAEAAGIGREKGYL